MKNQDTFQQIAQSIIDALENHNVPWRKEWVSNGYTALSLATKNPYRGTNAFLLSFSAQMKGYASPWWGTYKQIQAHGGQVRKGEKSTTVVLWKQMTREDDNGDKKTFPLMRTFSVFNAEQCDFEDGAPAYEVAVARSTTAVIESAQSVVDAYMSAQSSLQTTFGGDRAYYRPSADAINMPIQSAFTSDESFYATYFHEMAHSTGHKSRLNRDGVTETHSFGDADYSEEELVAEFTAAFLCGVTGCAPSTIENSTAYIKGWLSALKNDPKILVRATSRAQKAADFILGTNDKENESED